MNFLVLLLVALILKFTPWRKGFPLDLLGNWARRVAAAPARPKWQALGMLALPLLLVGLLLWLVEGIGYGVLTLLVHTFVLLLCVGRNDPLQAMTAQFEQAWERGDREAASLVAERDMSIRAENSIELLVSVRKRVVWEVCEGYLVPAFWYLLLGPLGAMAYRMLQQLQTPAEHPLRALAVSVVHALEWLPARLMVLSMALVGHFERTLAALGEVLRSWEVSAEQVTGQGAEAALDAPDTEVEHRSVMPPLRRLLQRCLFVWAVAIAFLSVLA
ncbi:MAG: regulatory signaling modulator protein AmpE [Pseudomonas sp.]|nr:regulatory signaling modulator protein AmpE [Pseudomonas sp.]